MNINCIVHCRMRNKRFLQLMGTLKSIQKSTSIENRYSIETKQDLKMFPLYNKELAST